MPTVGENGFYTLKGYQLQSDAQVTGTMEDYLEMICRHVDEQGFVRISQIAKHLNVKPSSASKMVQNLGEAGLVDYERYGVVRPTAAGWELGEYLLRRHRVLDELLTFINSSEAELRTVEQIEHYFPRQTIDNVETLLEKLHVLRAQGLI